MVAPPSLMRRRFHKGTGRTSVRGIGYHVVVDHRTVRKAIGRLAALAGALAAAIALLVVLITVVPPVLGGAYRAWAQHMVMPTPTPSARASAGSR